MVVHHQPLHRMLSFDEPTKKILPLDEVSFNPEDDSGSVVSNISEDNNDVIRLGVGEDLQSSSSAVQHDADITAGPPRSIFSNYWKAGGSPVMPVASSSRFSSHDPHEVQSRRTIMPRPQHYVDIDPYEHFGLRANEPEEKDGSINTYERMLQRHELHARSKSPPCRHVSDSRPLWLFTMFGVDASSSARTSSAPSLRRIEEQHDLAKRVVISDSALVKTPKKSSLRRGRFSCGFSSVEESTFPCPTTQDPKLKETTAGGHHHAVSFQPRVDVYVFQPPVETWAPKGWSNWFG